MKISIIIPNYNGAHLLKSNIKKLFAVLGKTKLNTEVILIDDASCDTSRDVINELQKTFSIKTYYKEKNTGFSSTVNSGVSLATGELLLLLNTDVTPELGFLEPLIGQFSDKQVFAVGCMDKSVEKEGIVLRGRGIGKFSRGFLLHQKGDNEKTNTLWVSGGSGMFRKSYWDKLHGLDELFDPFYWEDIDLSYRAQKAGFTCLFEKRSTVVHEHEKGAIKSKYTANAVKQIAYRNQFLFVWKNITSASYIVRHICWLPINLLLAIKSGDTNLLLGFLNALVFVPQILLKRSYQNTLTKISDEALLQKFIL